MNARISVVVVAYNRKRFLKEAICSVFENAYDKKKLEIIVVKDYVDEELDSYLLTSGIILIQTGEADVGRQLSMGVEKASGEIICFLDDDDRFKSNKFKVVDANFKRYPNLVYYHNQTASIDDKSSTFRGNAHLRIKDDIMVPKASLDALWKGMRKKRGVTLYSLIFNLSSVSIKRSSIVKYIDFLGRIIDGTDWFAFCCGIMERGDILFGHEILTDYRVHDSASNSYISVKTLSDFSKFLTEKLTLPNHGTFVAEEMTRGTEFNQMVWAKMFEEKILLRNIGIKQKVRCPLWEYKNYLLCRHTIIRNPLKKIIYIFGSIFIPRQLGALYILYRKHILKKGLKD